MLKWKISLKERKIQHKNGLIKKMHTKKILLPEIVL